MPDRVSRSPRSWVRPLVIVVAFVVVGALAGVIWEAIWSPPRGVVFRGEWFLEPSGPDLAFDATGSYVVVALLTGVVTGLLSCWRASGRELVTLVAIAVGSVLAGWVMYQVGHALGPPDPRPLAAGLDDYAELPSDLRLAGADEGSSPYVFVSTALAAFPVGALFATMWLFLSTSTLRRHREADDDPTGPVHAATGDAWGR